MNQPQYKIQLVGVLLLWTASLFSSAQTKDSALIAQVMQSQLDAWNSGSIEGFMQGYWQDPQLRFVTKKGVTYGWQTVLDNYNRSFPDKGHMGKLTFINDRISPLNQGMYLVTGVWKVDASEGNKSGFYSLLFKKIQGKWLIIVDHTF